MPGTYILEKWGTREYWLPQDSSTPDIVMWIDIDTHKKHAHRIVRDGYRINKRYGPIIKRKETRYDIHPYTGNLTYISVILVIISNRMIVGFSLRSSYRYFLDEICG